MSFYNLTFKDSQGQLWEMSHFKGKVLLIVNTATKCGLAPQFRELESLHQKYKDNNVAIIGFPCDQFLKQEPESNDTMVETCNRDFGVTFLLAEKIFVNGKKTHPVFQYLKNELPGGIFGDRIKWNFTKFLLSPQGKPVKRYSPITKPREIEQDIVALIR